MHIDLTKTIYDQMCTHQFVMSVMGNFDQDILRSFLKITTKKLESIDTDGSIKRKIFHFVVECAQTLVNFDSTEKYNQNNLFVIGKHDSNYFIHLGCVYTKAEVKQITEVIDAVNKLESTEIKKQFYNELCTKDLAHQDNILMSVLDIAKRTKSKINYDIFSIDPIHDFFSFKIAIAGE